MSIPKLLDDEKFASSREVIRILYRVDENFKSLCDDYSISKLCIERYEEKVQEDTQCKKEYEFLFSELEEEILRYVEKNSLNRNVID